MPIKFWKLLSNEGCTEKPVMQMGRSTGFEWVINTVCPFNGDLHTISLQNWETLRPMQNVSDLKTVWDLIGVSSLLRVMMETTRTEKQTRSVRNEVIFRDRTFFSFMQAPPNSPSKNRSKCHKNKQSLSLNNQQQQQQSTLPTLLAELLPKNLNNVSSTATRNSKHKQQPSWRYHSFARNNPSISFKSSPNATVSIPLPPHSKCTMPA